MIWNKARDDNIETSYMGATKLKSNTPTDSSIIVH